MSSTTTTQQSQPAQSAATLGGAATAVHPYQDILHRVEKPARYTGGEFQSVTKDWQTTDVRYALCFPDIYDIGMSHLGTKILYKLVNELPWALGERVFSPWLDMEEKLREHNLPLVSLETWRPLSDFDVIGFSLQYEMTYTNVLNMLDLGGVPIRNVDRGENDPFVIAGGPSATHPEPITPFVDALVIGDGEETLPAMLRVLREAKKQGWKRQEVLLAWAKLGGIYCPDLYTRDVVDDGGFDVVTGTTHPDVPARVQRHIIEDIDRYPFPDDAPVAAAQAIFDRMSIEIARGCTEGCRFCQAGMIYRPVRERSPKAIVDAVLGAIDKAGYDEVSLSCLSTADYSCISPLIKEISSELRGRNTSLSVASLRAYGLAEDLLEEIGSIRATSLTFAPEAGTQRMRDVINKNITDENLHTTAHRVFSRNWQKVKCYFMIGLPTEEEEDVIGIIETAKMMRKIGRQYKGSAEVTVSVSSHVPKPHTPFQWAAMDTPDQIAYKHDLLYHGCKSNRLKLRRHDARISFLECVVGRGDRRIGDVVELAWKKGARFDGWDRHLRFAAWLEAFAELDIRPERYIERLREDVALPWDHIDVGLADGFLLREWKRSLKNRLSPPCGKPKGMQVHHTNVADAEMDVRKLICYHCGVACDMTAMRSERVDFLTELGALERPVAKAEVEEPVAATTDEISAESPDLQPISATEPEAELAAELAAKPEKPARDPNLNARGKPRKGKRIKHPPRAPYMGPVHRYRLRFSKQGAESLTSHLDLVRSLPRVFRRAGLPLRYSDGFHPKPVLSFAPALPLGTRSVDEVMDIDLTVHMADAEVLTRLQQAQTTGLQFLAAHEVKRSKHKLVSELEEARYRVELRPGPDHPPMDTVAERDEARRKVEQALFAFIDAEHWPGEIMRKKRARQMDMRVDVAHLGMDAEGLVRLSMRLHGGATVRPQEVMNAALGGLGWFVPTEPVHVERTDLILRKPAVEAAVPEAAVPEAVSTPAVSTPAVSTPAPL